MYYKERNLLMNHLISGLQKSLSIVLDTKKQYRKLQKHLNNQPVGFPSTFTGVEIDLLKEMFSIDEAKIALYLNYRFESLETVYKRAEDDGYSESQFVNFLEEMEKKGSIFVRIDDDNNKFYALHPFVIGMFEMQLKRMTPGFYMKTRTYMLQQFAYEYLSTEILQMRVIPVHKSITPAHNIATYDQIKGLVEGAHNRISLAECICRKGKDSIGQPCEKTDQREVCIGFRDFHDTYTRHHWGRTISKEQALEILDQNEKSGLVLMPSNSQNADFVCSCCNCCCGILEMLNMVTAPAKITSSNYYCELTPDACIGCGICQKRCPTGAIIFKGKNAISINTNRCIGCGLCVSTCKPGALQLRKKDQQFIPPKNHDDLYDYLMAHKKTAIEKIFNIARAFTGL